ncbi:MAG: cysteine-rich small domain-containing protein [Clostridia bacterium]|nr:cysteine-rich small domain-containing protein [Clostridia bacterium]
MKENHRFYQNRDCPYFPCHSGVPEETFSCLFCYCPLYALGRRCGGACTYLKNGVKSCENCTFPHRAENYDAVLSRWEEIDGVVRREDARQE